MSEHHPDLPILDELGAEFEELARAAEPRRARRLADRPARDVAARRSQARRIGRRAAIVVLLICMVGGGALAALRGGQGDRDTAPATLGRGPGGSWTFSAYRHDGRLCTLFTPRGGDSSSSCRAAPRRDRVWAESALASGRRYVFGVVGPGVAQIEASLGGRVARGRADQRARVGPEHGGIVGLMTEVRMPDDRDAARDSGFPPGEGWFVLDLGPAGRSGRGLSPAVLVPLTRRSARAGAPYVDCSLGRLTPACRARIEARSGAR